MKTVSCHTIADLQNLSKVPGWGLEISKPYKQVSKPKERVKSSIKTLIM